MLFIILHRNRIWEASSENALLHFKLRLFKSTEFIFKPLRICILAWGSGKAVLREEEDAAKARHLIVKSRNNILFHWRQNLLCGQD